MYKSEIDRRYEQVLNALAEGRSTPEQAIKDVKAIASICTCGEPSGKITEVHYYGNGKPCYVRDEELKTAIWNAIKVWDIERTPGEGLAHATGTDADTILAAINGRSMMDLLRDSPEGLAG